MYQKTRSWDRHSYIRAYLDSKRKQINEEASKLVLKQLTSKSKSTNRARRLPIRTNKVRGQPNDHWGLDTIHK
jgi:hypothetical protein